MKHFTFIISSALLATILAAGCSGNNSSERQTIISDSLEEKSIASYKAGEVLFKQHCAACHGLPGKMIDGPTLFDNLFERLPQPADQYFVTFVMNGKILKESGDTYYNQLQKTYRNTNIEHDYSTKISDAELRNIMLYIKSVE